MNISLKNIIKYDGFCYENQTIYLKNYHLKCSRLQLPLFEVAASTCQSTQAGLIAPKVTWHHVITNFFRQYQHMLRVFRPGVFYTYTRRVLLRRVLLRCVLPQRGLLQCVLPQRVLPRHDLPRYVQPRSVLPRRTQHELHFLKVDFRSKQKPK